MEDWSKFKDDQYEDDGELLLGMRELNQRQRELKMTEDEWVAVWMLSIMKKRKRLDKFVYQSLRDVIKVGGDNVVKNFEEKFKELRVEGHRKESNSSASVMFTEENEYFDEKEIEDEEIYDDDQEESLAEDEEKETYFMGTQRQARKRFNINRSQPIFTNRFNRRQSPYYTPNRD